MVRIADLFPSAETQPGRQEHQRRCRRRAREGTRGNGPAQVNSKGNAKSRLRIVDLGLQIEDERRSQNAEVSLPNFCILTSFFSNYLKLALRNFWRKSCPSNWTMRHIS